METGKQAVPFGYVPLTNIGVWWQLPYSHFVYSKRWRMMGPPALAAALGHTRAMVQADVDEAQKHADNREKPEEVTKMTLPSDLHAIPVFTLSAHSEHTDTDELPVS